jgi:hypothetical protein
LAGAWIAELYAEPLPSIRIDKFNHAHTKQWACHPAKLFHSVALFRGAIMLKLYKRLEGDLYYHEAWAHGSKITEHWGKVGERGETADHKGNKKLSEEKNIEQILAKPLSDGYVPIEDDDLAILLIEYTIEGMGTPKDLEKRHAVESRMNETLGWTGVGHCDGGSIGSGTMEVCCFVVDFEIAKRVIEAELKGTKFGNFSRICKE